MPNGNDIITGSDYIVWGQSPLSWDDFKGPARSKKAAAGTFGGISFAKKENEPWKAFAYFDKTLSWKRLKSDEGLKHEQYHFNIVEIYARKLRKDIAEKKVTLDYSAAFRNYVYKTWEQVEEMQSLYDRETDNSRDTTEQAQWQKQIDGMLDSLDGFKSIIIN